MSVSKDGKALVVVTSEEAALAMVREHLRQPKSSKVSKGWNKGGEGRKGGQNGKGAMGRNKAQAGGGQVAKKPSLQRFTGGSNTVPMLLWHDFQLIGDSMLSRVVRDVLGEKPVYSKTLRTRQLGLCIHGYTIAQMGRLLSSNKAPGIHSKVIVMLGTNDLLKHVPVDTIIKGLHSLVVILSTEADSVYILTLPPVPRLADKESHWTQLEKINETIMKIAEANANVTALCAGDCFKDARAVKEELFEQKFSDGRQDGIHFNINGIKAMISFLSNRLQLGGNTGNVENQAMDT